MAKDVYKVCPVRNTPEAIRRFFGQDRSSVAARLTDTVRRKLAVTFGFAQPQRKRR